MKGISFNILAGCDNMTLMVDSFRIQQILLNLLSNAIKFSSKKYVQVTMYAKELMPHQYEI
jgi:signal transduction histidine kinase